MLDKLGNIVVETSEVLIFLNAFSNVVVETNFLPGKKNVCHEFK
jgi:hypothetical protein